MVIVLPDIAGDGATHQLVPSGDTRRAAWIQFIVSGAGTARIGDPNTSGSQGFPVPAGGGMFYPWRKMPESELYVLSNVYYNVPVGATLTVGYSQD